MAWPGLHSARCWESRETGYLFLPGTLRHTRTQLENICISVLPWQRHHPGNLLLSLHSGSGRHSWSLKAEVGGEERLESKTLSQSNQYIHSLGGGGGVDLWILVKENVLSRGDLLR